jgi:HSP20 family molecular chaperone IbpA
MLGNVGSFGTVGWPAGRRRRRRGTSALTPFTGAAGGAMMQMDMYEQPDKFEVVMDMPGVNKEDVNISVDDQSNTLTVTTERKEQSDRDEFGWVTRERSWGKSVRSMVLPNTADLQKADVELRVSQHITSWLFCMTYLSSFAFGTRASVCLAFRKWSAVH